MNSLLPKMNLLKDISTEYANSAKSVENVQRECENLLNRLQFELTLRLQEKGRFITKVGVSLREMLLENYRGLINRIHHEYCRNEEILLQMMHQYRNLQQTIHNVQFSIEELKKLKRWTLQESNFMKFKNNAKFYNQSIMFNKQNIHYQSINFDKNTFKPHEWKTQQKHQFKRESKWPNLNVQSKSRKDELIIMQKKLQQDQIADLDLMINECLSSLADLSFFTEKKKVEKQEIRKSYQSQSSPYEANTHGISLGLQSLNNDEINLLCSEQIDDLNISKSDGLQKITEREEEYSESSLNQTPNRKSLLS